MIRPTFLAFALAGLSFATSAPAAPLTFGAINGVDDLSRKAEIGSCQSDAKDGAIACTLARNTFGDVPIAKSTMTLNAAGRATSVVMVLDDKDYDRAYLLLVGRYGRPTPVQGVPVWGGFDDGALLTIRKAAPNAIVTFAFPANEAAPSRPALSSAVAWSLLLFLSLGLGAGLVLRRRRMTSRTEPTLSMRATLERKIRDGGDLQF